MKKSLNDCKSCRLHKGMENDNTVKCGMVKDYTVVVNAMPSNRNKGFRNGEIVVECKYEE